MAYDYGGSKGDYSGSYDDDYGDERYGSERPNVASADQDLAGAKFIVPDVVKTFVVYFYRHIREQNVYEIHQMYEGSWNKLSERMFKQSLWPPVEAIAPLVDHDHVFCILYKEMYFRHVYVLGQPTLEQRCDSWDNYCSLFQVILHENVNMQLPNQWLWDMIDEFIYQFQAFCQYRAKLKQKSEQELALLKQCSTVWNVYGVLNYLQAVIDKSGIVGILASEAETGNLTFSATDGYDYGGGSNVLKVLGYLSLIGLPRVHCLVGDYHGALVALSPIDVFAPGVFTRIVGSHITAMYYFGFASLMTRRYTDAIRGFNQILLYIMRTKQYHEKSPQFEQILKKNEQMYSLLAIALSLCPQPKLVEESVANLLREKTGEKMTRMQRWDESVFDELFSYACPKFITPSSPDFDAPPVDFNQEAYRLQLKMFLTEVRQQQRMSSIRSFVKLYTTISVPKLASFMESDEASLRASLLTYKHKTHTLDLDGNMTSNADIEFYIDEDMVHVVDVKSTKSFGDYFLRHIAKFEGVIREVEQVQLE